MPDSKKRLLFIDDERDVCEVLKTKFQIFGFEVFVAHDGKEGFEKASKIKPHCIILDIRMPREDGLTFLRRLRAYRSDDLDLETEIRKIPVLVLTAAGDQMQPLFHLEGISDYVEKPFDSEDLRNRILKVIVPV